MIFVVLRKYSCKVMQIRQALHSSIFGLIINSSPVVKKTLVESLVRIPQIEAYLYSIKNGGQITTKD